MLTENLRTQDRVVAEVRRFVEAEVMAVVDRPAASVWPSGARAVEHNRGPERAELI